MDKHPYHRQVFYIGIPALRYSLREIKSAVLAGSLNPHTIISDTDGGRYTAENIGRGVAPKWARSAEHDPMLHGIPTPSAEDIEMVNEILCEPDFLEMPQE